MARTCGISNVIVTPAEPEVILTAVAGVLGTPPPARVPNAEEFDRKHLRLLTNKLSQKTDDLKATNERLSALIELNLQLGSELDPQRLLQGFGTAARDDPACGIPSQEFSTKRAPGCGGCSRVVWTPVRR